MASSVADSKAAEPYVHDRTVPTVDHDNGMKSLGVRRVEAINAELTRWLKVTLFVGLFLVAYSYGLDGTLRYTYQPYATASYNTHSLLATVNVLRSVIAAAAQPTVAKLMDVFGRFEVLAVSIVFYVVGTVIEATATGVNGFAGGAILYQIGYTTVMLLAEVIVADTTSLRNRVLFSFIPAAPFIINAWVAGDVGAAVLAATTWNWGIGMWAIIYPVSALPLLFVLWYASRKAARRGGLAKHKTAYQEYGFGQLATTLFWQLDVIGVILLIAVFSLILVPFTIAGKAKEAWSAGHIIAMLVIGFVTLPVFIWWESKASHPLVPFHLIKDRGAWAALCIAPLLNFAWYLQGAYLYTVLVVAFDESILSATRITNVYSFTSVVVGIGLGFVVRYVRYLKPFIISGIVLFAVAFGLMIRFRGGEGASNHAAIIGSQVVLGFGGGMFSYPTQASIQAITKHEHLAVVTALYLSSFQIGSAFGNAVSGAIWTQVLPGQLSARLTNQTLAVEAYGNPFAVAVAHPFGTPERDGIVAAYRHTQRLLCITGICLCVPLLIFALLLRNPRLTDEQTSAEAERATVSSDADSDVKA